MRFTGVWARWQGGWLYIADDDAPVVIQTSQGHSGDRAEVIHKVTAELATYGDGQTEITVGIDPTEDDPIPGVDWREGHEVNVDGHGWVDTEALACFRDDSTGRWRVVPQFGTVLDAPSQRIDRTLRSVGGVNRGTSHLARPTATLPAPNVRPG